MSVDVNEKRHVDIENLRISYPRLVKILAEMQRCREFSKIAAEPRCMLVTGFQGVGKTKLYEHYQAQNPSYEEAEITVVPVLSSIIPAQATVKGLVSQLLEDLGEPIFDKGNIHQQTSRLRHLLKECRTELIILDEFQHIIDRDSTKVLQSTADWLKNLLNKLKIPLVLIGMPSCVVILQANPQLRRRFSIRAELPPFTWSGLNAENEIQILLKVIEQKLPLKKRSNLSDPEMAYRIYCATGGFMSSIMKLVRGGAHEAIDSEIEQITLNILEKIYEEELAMNAPGYPNPFSTSNTNPEPLEIEQLVSQATPGGRRPKLKKRIL